MGASQRPCHDVVSLGVICNYNYTVCVSVTVMSVMPHASCIPAPSLLLSTLSTLATSWLFGSPERLQFHPDNQQINTRVNILLQNLSSMNYEVYFTKCLGVVQKWTITNQFILTDEGRQSLAHVNLDNMNLIAVRCRMQININDIC